MVLDCIDYNYYYKCYEIFIVNLVANAMEILRFTCISKRLIDQSEEKILLIGKSKNASKHL